MMPPLSGASVR